MIAKTNGSGFGLIGFPRAVLTQTRVAGDLHHLKYPRFGVGGNLGCTLTFFGNPEGLGDLIQVEYVGLDSIETTLLLELHLRHLIPKTPFHGYSHAFNEFSIGFLAHSWRDTYLYIGSGM
jgi:hypothetical protein